jgi:Zn-dependent M28 family amino/carboxypeptidase
MVGSEFVGADDAASAVAAIVEIARVLAEEPARAERVELVFFDGEESIESNITETDGLYGSNHYAKAWQGEVAKPRFGILLDMIGHRDLRIRIPSDSPAHLRAALMAAAEKRGALEHFGIARGPIIDDHVPLNQAGVATIDVIGDFSSTTWWHTPADNLALIDPQSLEISIGTTLEMLRSLLP